MNCDSKARILTLVFIHVHADTLASPAFYLCYNFLTNKEYYPKMYWKF